jgi:hypothetical protein
VKKIAWSDQARSDVRKLDCPTAMRIFAALHRFAETGQGDVKRLKEEVANSACALATIASASPRKRVAEANESGEKPDSTLHIHAVRHRSQAYK